MKHSPNRFSVVAIASFLVGAGLFAGAHISAQTNAIAGPLGALHSRADGSPPTCDAGYFPQEFVYQINSGSFSSDISTDSANWYQCVPPQYVFPAQCYLITSSGGPNNTSGIHDHVVYKYGLAGGSAQLLEYGDSNDPGMRNSVINTINLPTPSGNSGYSYSLDYVGEAHEVDLVLTNAAGQQTTCQTSVYRQSGTSQIE